MGYIVSPYASLVFFMVLPISVNSQRQTIDRINTSDLYIMHMIGFIQVISFILAATFYDLWGKNKEKIINDNNKYKL